MQGPVKERILRLCAEAADEQDAGQFRQLVHDITMLLQEKQDRLDRAQTLKREQERQP